MKQNSKYGWIVSNLIWAAIVLVVIVIVAQISLGAITRHNKELEVPDFRNMSMEKATALAKSNSMRLDVTDSVFVKRMERGYVYGQNPVPGSMVKKGRRILITINATVPKTVEMPSLVGFSLRQAKTELLSRGLTVGHLEYVDDIATNNVLEQKYKGKNVRPGAKVVAETPIDLVLGLNYEESLTYVPHLIGLTYEVAKDMILDNSLNIGKVTFDETVHDYTDTLQALIYSQSPAYTSESPFPMGTAVSIYLTKSKAKVAGSK